MFWGDETDIDQRETHCGLMVEKGRLNTNNKANKSMTRIILLSSNKQTDAMGQVSDDDPVISRGTRWQNVWTRIRLDCLYLNSNKKRREMFAAQRVLKFTTVSKTTSQTLPYRAGNDKTTSEYQPEQRAWWTKATQWIEEVTHRN